MILLRHRRFSSFLICSAIAAVHPGAAFATTGTDTADLANLTHSVGQWYDGDVQEHDGHLEHVDVKTQEQKVAHWKQVLDSLSKIDRARLDLRGRLDYDVLKYQANVAVNRVKYRTYEQPVNSDTSFWTELTDNAREPFPDADAYRRYLVQLHDIPRYFSEQTVNMKSALARGFTPPQITMKGRDSGLRVVTDAPSIQESPFMLPFRQMPASISEEDQKKMRAEAETAIRDEVLPAYRKFLDFFDHDYVPHSRQELGANKLPDGAAYYQAQIYEFTTTTLSPEEIHRIGLDAVSKIHQEMLESMRASGYKGDFPAFLKFLRSDPRFYAKTPEDLLKDASWIAKEFDGVSGRFFGFLPRSRFGIRPVPADEAPFYTSGRGGPGVYLVNTYKLGSRPLYALPALTLHESAPGHALQMSLVDEDNSLPSFRKDYISAYGEGWAVYCERLGDEMGIYHTPYDRFGMLNYQAWRAARLVVDTGLHTMGWSREQARDYFRQNTALPEHEIETEVDRYIAWPGQALSYYLGEAEIWRLRHRAEAELGSKFNLRAFHDTVLSTGSIPLRSLDEVVEQFIKDGGKGPHPDTE